MKVLSNEGYASHTPTLRKPKFRFMDKTIRFWRDLLGMRLVAGLGQPGYRHYFFEISPNDLIAFFEWEGVEPMVKKEHGRPVSGRFGFDHVRLGLRRRKTCGS